METNIKSGFRACEIVPLSPDTNQRKIPDTQGNEDNNGNEEHLTNILRDFILEGRPSVSRDAT